LIWYRKSADQKYADAMNSLGVALNTGWNVEKNEAEAFKLFRQAAELDNYFAQYHLARAYEEGRVVQADMTEAIKWYRKSAAHGHEPAKKALIRLGDSQQ
jgi:TPR repeat protein